MHTKTHQQRISRCVGRSVGTETVRYFRFYSFLESRSSITPGLRKNFVNEPAEEPATKLNSLLLQEETDSSAFVANDFSERDDILADSFYPNSDYSEDLNCGSSDALSVNDSDNSNGHEQSLTNSDPTKNNGAEVTTNSEKLSDDVSNFDEITREEWKEYRDKVYLSDTLKWKTYMDMHYTGDTLGSNTLGTLENG